MTTLATLPATVSRAVGAKVALITHGGSVTYPELDLRSTRVARALCRDGVARGDRVVMLGKESLDAMTLLFGVAKAQAVYTAINWRLSVDEIAYAVNDSGARWLFVDVEHAPIAARVTAQSERPPRVIVIGGAHEAWSTFEEFCADADAAAALPVLSYDADDPVVQMYTSGTTGYPKGVVLAHRSFFAIARALEEASDPWIGWTSGSVSLLFVPTFHIGGMWWLIRGLALGSTNVVLRAFDPAAILDAIGRYRVTKTCMVPAMMQVLLGEPAIDEADLSSLETIVYGGSPISATLLEGARAKFGCDFCQIYGMTETGNMAVSLRPGDHADARDERLRAAGRALPGVALRILDKDGRELGVREMGEIFLRSPARMVEYWRRPEETALALADGWVRTGDAGYRDEEGFVYICDRVKDMIISAGENIYPAEIENVLREHRDVADVAVIGVPDDLWGESVKAFVVPQRGATLAARDVVRHARARLAEFKVPKSVELVDALPRNASGKLLKKDLREPYWKDRERRVN